MMPGPSGGGGGGGGARPQRQGPAGSGGASSPAAAKAGKPKATRFGWNKVAKAALLTQLLSKSACAQLVALRTHPDHAGHNYCAAGRVDAEGMDTGEQCTSQLELVDKAIAAIQKTMAGVPKSKRPTRQKLLGEVLALQEAGERARARSAVSAAAPDAVLAMRGQKEKAVCQAMDKIAGQFRAHFPAGAFAPPTAGAPDGAVDAHHRAVAAAVAHTVGTADAYPALHAQHSANPGAFVHGFIKELLATAPVSETPTKMKNRKLNDARKAPGKGTRGGATSFSNKSQGQQRKALVQKALKMQDDVNAYNEHSSAHSDQHAATAPAGMVLITAFGPDFGAVAHRPKGQSHTAAGRKRRTAPGAAGSPARVTNIQIVGRSPTTTKNIVNTGVALCKQVNGGTLNHAESAHVQPGATLDVMHANTTSDAAADMKMVKMGNQNKPKPVLTLDAAGVAGREPIGKG